MFVYESALNLGFRRKEPLPFLFLGLDWCHPATTQKVLEKGGETPIQEGWVVKSNSGMAGVIPAWKIEELLNEEPFANIRRRQDEHFKAIVRSAHS